MKKFLKKVACLIVMATTVMSATMAQDAQPTSADNKKIEFSLHLGGAVPLGDFGDSRIRDEEPFVAWSTKESDKGGAGFGANVGMKLKFNIPSVKGLGIIVTADLFWNGANADLKDLKEDLLDEMLEGFEYYGDYFEEEEEVYEAKIKLPNYLNIPIMAGLNYEYSLNNGISLWGEGAVGINIAKVTNLEMYEEGHYYYSYYDPYYGSSGTIEYDYESRSGLKYDIQTGLAFQLGIGVKFADKFSIGLHYYALGKVKLEGELYEEWYDSDEGEEFYEESFKLKSVSPSIFAIRLGFHF